MAVATRQTIALLILACAAYRRCKIWFFVADGCSLHSDNSELEMTCFMQTKEGALTESGHPLLFLWAGLLLVVAKVAAEGLVVEDDFALEVGVVVVFDALDEGARGSGLFLDDTAEGVVLVFHH